jgi:hypothetical protein
MRSIARRVTLFTVSFTFFFTGLVCGDWWLIWNVCASTREV